MATAVVNELPKPAPATRPQAQDQYRVGPRSRRQRPWGTRRAGSEGHALGGAPGSPAPPSWRPRTRRDLRAAAAPSGAHRLRARKGLPARCAPGRGPRTPAAPRTRVPAPAAASRRAAPRTAAPPRPRPLRGSATPTSVSPGADPNARAPAARLGFCPQFLPLGDPSPFSKRPGPPTHRTGLSQGAHSSRPWCPHPAPELGRRRPRPQLAGTLPRQELRPPAPRAQRRDPGPPRPSPAQPPPGAPGARLTSCRRRSSLAPPPGAAPAGLSRGRGPGAAHAPAAPPPPQQLSRLGGLGDSAAPGRCREGAGS